MPLTNTITITSQMFAIGFGLAASGSAGSSLLDSAYVHNTSGDAIGVRYIARVAQPIDKLWVFVDSVDAGSPTLECQIYNERTGETARAGATLRDTSTATSAIGADNWVEFTFGTPYTPAVGEILWFVVYNNHATPASNNLQIRSATNMDLQGLGHAVGYFTTTGFLTSGSLLIEIPHMVKQGSFYFGQPFTQLNSTYYTSNTRERGIKFTAPMTFSVSQVHAVASANVSDVKIYDGATGTPGGSTLASYDMDSDANETLNDLIGVKVFDTEFEFEQGSEYIVSMTLSGNLQTPSVLQIEDYSRFASDFDALRDSCPWLPVGVIANAGATAFDVEKNVSPAIRLPLSSYPTESSGGGLLRHPGMAGGFIA